MRIGPSGCLLLTLTGCATDDGGGPGGIVFLSRTQHVASAESLFSPDEDKCLASPTFLVSMFSDQPQPTGVSTKVAQKCQDLAKSFKAALTPTQPPPGNAGSAPTDSVQQRRNEMIDALVATSNRKCGRYVSFLKAYDGNVNVTLGLASLITAGLSPIAGGEATAKALGGASAIFNGSRETFNQAHFANQTIQVLAVAFDKARQEQRKTITNYEQCPINQYTLMRGFEDVFRYHSSCSVVYGLAETARAVERASAPDLATIKTMLIQLAELRKSADAFANPKTMTPDANPQQAAAAPAVAAPAKPVVAAPAALAAPAAVPAAAVPPVKAAADPAMASAEASSSDVHDVPVCPFSPMVDKSVQGAPAAALPAVAAPAAAPAKPAKLVATPKKRA